MLLSLDIGDIETPGLEPIFAQVWSDAPPTGFKMESPFHPHFAQFPCLPLSTKYPSERAVKHQTEACLWQNIKKRTLSSLPLPVLPLLSILFDFHGQQPARYLILPFKSDPCYLCNNDTMINVDLEQFSHCSKSNANILYLQFCHKTGHCIGATMLPQVSRKQWTWGGKHHWLGKKQF